MLPDCVTVLGTRYVLGGSPHRVVRAPLGEALQRAFPCDAHFAPYDSDATLATRLVRPLLGSCAIWMTALVLDIDATEHQPTPNWRAQEAIRVGELLRNGRAAGGFCYYTRGGYRLVWRLAKPFAVSNEADAAAWRATYLAECDALSLEHGIQADRSCADWQRLYRLPHATRETGGKPEAMSTWGDPNAIASIELPGLRRQHPPSIQASRQAPPEQLGSMVEVGGIPELEASPLYRKLRDTRALGPRIPGGLAFRMRCPRGAEHSGSDGLDGSTLFFPPGGAGSYGHIHCHHAGHADVDLDALVLTGGEVRLEQHVVQLVEVGIERAAGEVRVVCRLAQPAPLRFLRVSSRSKARWHALWVGADVAPPDDDGDDLSAACRELTGARVVVECQGSTPRRILPTTEQAA